MELQDRSRLYPNLSPPPSNLVMGSDGRLQYAPLPQAPPVPQQAYFQPAPQMQYVPSAPIYPVISAPVVNPEAFDAQKSLNRWGKVVRIASGLLLFVTIVSHVMLALKLADPEREGPPVCKFLLVARFVFFVLLCITAKLGMRAGKFKTSQSALKFIKFLTFMGLLTLSMIGYISYKKMSGGYHKGNKEENGKDHNHNHNHNEENENDSEIDKKNDFDNDSRSLNEAKNKENVQADRDEYNEGKIHHNGKEHIQEPAESNDEDENNERNNHHNGKENHEGRDHHEGNEEDEQQGRGHHGRYGRHGKSGRCGVILAGIAIVVYGLLLFLAFKLYKAAKKYENLAQRGSVPMAPVFAQQPVLAYAPGMYPGHIPMGAPVHNN